MENYKKFSRITPQFQEVEEDKEQLEGIGEINSAAFT